MNYKKFPLPRVRQMAKSENIKRETNFLATGGGKHGGNQLNMRRPEPCWVEADVRKWRCPEGNDRSLPVLSLAAKEPASLVWGSIRGADTKRRISVSSLSLLKKSAEPKVYQRIFLGEENVLESEGTPCSLHPPSLPVGWVRGGSRDSCKHASPAAPPPPQRKPFLPLSKKY